MHRNSERDSKNNDSVAQLVEQMTLNHWVESSSLSGVTKGSINPQKSSENHWFSELFLFTPYPRSAQNIETAGVQEGCSETYAANCTLVRMYFAIFQYIAAIYLCDCCTLIGCCEGAMVRRIRW